MGQDKRYEVLRWIHAAEGIYLMHAMPVFYNRSFQKSGDPAETEKGMSINVCKDMDFLESELGKSGRFLCGDHVTAADIMMAFSINALVEQQLGTAGKIWKKVNDWCKDCKEMTSYIKAVERTGHTFDVAPKT